jgi:hypothetical protein
MATKRGSCLCGGVTWEAEGPFELMGHCHCSRCRKTHGTAFSTSMVAPAAGFRFRSGQDAIVTNESAGGRSFCGRCGATTPAATRDGRMFVHAGSLDDDPGVRPLAHIFVGSKAPWYEFPPADALPRFDAWPPGFDYPVLPEPPLEPTRPGVVRGSCLCSGVAFEMTGPPTTVRYCHCSRCRKARAAAHATNLVAPMEAVRFVRGEERVRIFKLPEARFFSQAFCADCGGKLPRLDPGRGIAIVPLGALDDDPGIRAACQIFVADRAPWVVVDERIPAYEQAAPA